MSSPVNQLPLPTQSTDANADAVPDADAVDEEYDNVECRPARVRVDELGAFLLLVEGWVVREKRVAVPRSIL